MNDSGAFASAPDADPISNVPRNLREVLSNVNPPERGKFVMRKIGVALAAALVIAGTAAASTGQAEWTTRDAKAAAVALNYPKPHARKTVCKGVGTGAAGLYTTFKCRSNYRRGWRTFSLVDDKTGWVCAGTHVAGCKILGRGFVSVGELGRLGGFAESATQTAGAYILSHYGGDAVGDACSNTSPGTWTCPYSTPAVTVTLTYKHVKDGWTFHATT